MDVYVISRVIGTVKLDVTDQESHDSTLRVTDNPVESGAVIADHAALEPRKLTITGTMVDWLESGVNVAPTGSQAPRANPDFLNQIALPPGVSSFTADTLFRVQSLSAAADYSLTIRRVTGNTRALAPWLPNFAPADTLDMSSGTKRVEQVFDNLRTIQKSADPVEIITGSQHYENMLLVAVNMTQSRDGWATLSITAQEIFIVETQTVSGISVKGGPSKSGRAGAQTMNTKEKGNVQTTPAGDDVKRSIVQKYRKGGIQGVLGGK